MRQFEVAIGERNFGEVNNYLVKIEDYTPLVRKIYDLLQKGDSKNASKLFPTEKPYPLPAGFGKHLMMS